MFYALRLNSSVLKMQRGPESLTRRFQKHTYGLLLILPAIFKDVTANQLHYPWWKHQGSLDKVANELHLKHLKEVE